MIITEKFYKIKKIAQPNENKGTLEVVINFERLKDYNGYDVFPDDKIGDLIVACGLHFKRSKNWDKIKRKFI